MKFLLEYLDHFTASDILHMYGDGAFRTAEEIKVADFSISFKVIFHDNHISPDDLKIYKHLQRIVDAIRVHQLRNGSKTEEYIRFFSQEEVHFNNFVLHSECEREVTRINVFERRISFSFKPVEKHEVALIWLANALEELLSYVLRDSEEADRVGIIIKYETCQEHNAAFPIKLKNQLRTSIVTDTVTSILRTRGPVITGQKMILQLVRIRLPTLYRKLTPADVMGVPGNDSLC